MEQQAKGGRVPSVQLNRTCTHWWPDWGTGGTGLPLPPISPDLRDREQSSTIFHGPLLCPTFTEADGQWGQVDWGLNLPQFSPGPVTSDDSFKPLHVSFPERGNVRGRA